MTPFADAIVGDATGSLCFPATSIAPVGQDFTTYVYGPRGHFVADFTGQFADTLHPKALPQPSGFQMLQEITPVFARLDVYTADGTLICESPVKVGGSARQFRRSLRGHTHPLEQLSSNMRTLDYARPGPSPEANRERQRWRYLDAAPLAGGGAAIGATLAGSLPAVYHSIAKLRVGDISQIHPGWLTPFLWHRVAIVLQARSGECGHGRGAAPRESGERLRAGSRGQSHLDGGNDLRLGLATNSILRRRAILPEPRPAARRSDWIPRSAHVRTYEQGIDGAGQQHREHGRASGRSS